ncbi:MAG: hypothetical protein J6T86_02140 [Bacteroidales bacterium]|nr:hypothetical protein [Bacteroidales bacterium]
MFYYLNKNTIIQLIAIIGLAIWALLGIFTQMTLLPPDNQAFLFQAIHPFLTTHAWCYKALAVILIAMTTIFLQRSFVISKFSDNITYMPILFFLLLLNLNHSFATFTPVFFTICTAALLLMMNAQNEHSVSIRNRIFSAGLILGISTLFDHNSIWLLLMMFLLVLTSSISKFKELLILLIGFLFVYLYLFTYGYLSDNIPAITDNIHGLGYLYIIHNLSTLQWTDWLLLAVLAVTLLLFTFAGKIYFDNKVVALRRRFIACILLTITLIVLGIFSPFGLQISLPYLLLPTSFIFGITALIEERKWLHDLFILATGVLLWL